MKRILSLIIILVTLISLASCILLSLEDYEELYVGTWLITENPGNIDPHYTLVFTSEKEYQFYDDQDDLFEEGTMTKVKKDEFHYTILRQDYEPTYVGNKNYAQLVITGTTMVISFYDDSSMQALFVTFTLVKQ